MSVENSTLSIFYWCAANCFFVLPLNDFVLVLTWLAGCVKGAKLAKLILFFTLRLGASLLNLSYQYFRLDIGELLVL